MAKEYIWTLKVEGEERVWKCVVHENECVTYEGDQESKHLKITNPTKKVGVLQIDTVTAVYGEMYPFQLENGEPYLMIDGKWKRSVTGHEERVHKFIRNQKITALMQIVIGIIACLACLIRYLIQNTMGNWFIALIIGSIIIVTGTAQLIDVRNAEKEIKNGVQ